MQKIFSFLSLIIFLSISFGMKGQIDCSTATAIQCGSPLSVVVNAGVGIDNFSYCGFQNEGKENYYSFTPAISGNYFIQIDDQGGNSTGYELRYGECLGANWNCLGIYSGSSATDFIFLTAGTNYVFCLDAQLSNTNFFGSILLNCPTPAPTNDECSNAQNISCGSPVAGTLNGATVDIVPNCLAQNNGEDGVWYSFTGNNSYVTFSTCGTSQFDSQLSVYSGDCGNLVCVVANDDNPLCEANGNSSYISFNALSGTNYFVCVHANTQPNINYNFSLNCSCAPLCSVPVNDNCTNAISLGAVSSATCSV